MQQPTFSDALYPANCMEIFVMEVKNHFEDDLKNKKVLDISTGNGWIENQLNESQKEIIKHLFTLRILFLEV